METYVYLKFDSTGASWRLATYDEMYSTVTNGGYFPWDDNAPKSDNWLGLRMGA